MNTSAINVLDNINNLKVMSSAQINEVDANSKNQ